MAEVVTVGTPANEYEQRTLDALRRKLPANYYVFSAVELVFGDRAYDVDAVVMAPHGYYLLDVKVYAGEIRGDSYQWWLPNGHYIDSPIETLERRKRLFSVVLDRVQHKHGVSAAMPVEALVVLANPRARSLIDDPRARTQVVALDELPRVLTDAARVGREGQAPGALGDAARAVRGHLARLLAPATPREVVGFYTVIAPLEETDAYTAYLAKHRYVTTAPEVKLKVYALDRQGGGTTREAALAQLFRELTAIKALGEHPAILGTAEVFTWRETQLVSVVPWRPGRYLAARLREEAFGPGQRLAVAADVADALAHAHARGVLHRAVRPDNVLVGLDGRGVLINFDLARIDHPGVSTVITRLASTRSSPYTAPEVAQGDVHAATARSDLYSLGVMLYFMLTGKYPAPRGAAPDSLPPPAAGAPAPAADPRVARVLRRLCAPDPAARYGDAAEAAADLRALAAAWAE